VGGIEVNGPVSELTVSEDSTFGFKITDLDIAIDKKVGYTEKSATDVEAGQKTDMGNTPGLTNGATPTSKNFTTTMDDASTGRLHNYSETSGTTG
jgi:hypothetical protein